MAKTRFDYVDLNVRKTDEGYFIDTPNVARTGILTYRNDDGSVRRELRLPEDVFHEDSLNSFVGKPITVDHPKGLISSADVDKFQVGTMLSKGRQDGENAKVDIVIHQPSKIGDRRQLSLGYNVDLDETPGEWNGQKYDAIQRNIRVNHLSIVKSARAGVQARLNMDSDEEPLTFEKVNMAKIRLDNGIEYEAPQEVIVAMDKLRADGETAATAITTLKAANDTLQARVDSIPTEISKATEAAKSALVRRANLEKVASTFKIDSADKSDADIKTAVIKTFNKDFDPTGKSEDYIQAAFDIAVSAPRNDAMASQRAAVGGSGEGKRADGSDVDYRSAYAQSLGSNAVSK